MPRTTVFNPTDLAAAADALSELLSDVDRTAVGDDQIAEVALLIRLALALGTHRHPKASTIRALRAIIDRLLDPQPRRNQYYWERRNASKSNFNVWKLKVADVTLYFPPSFVPNLGSFFG